MKITMSPARSVRPVPPRLFTPDEDAYLIANYHRQQLREMAAHLDRSWGVVQQRIEVLIRRGTLDRSRRFYHRPWTEQEDEFLHSRWGLWPDEKVARHLKRTVDACEIRATRHLDISRSMQFWTSRQVAELFGVDNHLVVDWIATGQLHAVKSPVGAGKRLRWAISDEAICDFIQQHPHEYDPKRIEWGSYHRNLANQVHADPWLTVDQAARALNVTRACVLHHLRRGWLPGQRKARGAGGQGEWRIQKSALALFAARHATTRGQRARRQGKAS